jgi:hypothetical protein
MYMVYWHCDKIKWLSFSSNDLKIYIIKPPSKKVKGVT